MYIYSVDSLLKVRDVKSTDGRNLLHAIVYALARDAPHHFRTLSELVIIYDIYVYIYMHVYVNYLIYINVNI